MRVAYLTTWFPVLTETFVLFELLAVEQLGVAVDLFPLRRARERVNHPEADPLLWRAQFGPLLSPSYLPAHGRCLARQPRAYLFALATLLRANLGSWRYFWGALGYFPRAVHLAQVVQSLGIQHIHAHFASHPAAVAWTLHRLTGIPYSFTAHGSDLHRDPHMLAEKVAQARFVVTVSHYNRRAILEVCGQQATEKVAVIRSGVDTRRIRPRELPTAFEAGRGPFHLVCIGRLHEVKGQRYLIEACGQLVSRGVELRCSLVGEGPDAAELVDLARQLCVDRCLALLGPLRHGEVLELLGTADALVAPSVATGDGRREGIPVALMEAMASGVPVVASRLSGIPELVDDTTGLLVEPRAAADLASAIGRLIDDGGLRARLGRAGRLRVEEEFDLETNARRLVALFAGDPVARTRVTERGSPPQRGAGAVRAASTTIA